MKLRPILTAATAAVFLASCNSGGKTGVHAPKDAAVVVHINNASLSSKLSWNEIKATNWFKQMNDASKDSLAQKFLNNPEASGIDMTKGLTFFMKKTTRGGYGVFEGSLKDAAAFEAFTKQTGKTATIKKEGDWSIADLNGEAMVAWDKTRFGYIVDMPFLNAMNNFGGGGMSNRYPADSLKKFVTGIFSLSDDQSMDSDDRFVKMMKEEGDMHLWMNSEYLYEGMAGGMASMMKINTLMKGNISASTLSFDAGKITMKSKQYYGKEVADILEKYPIKPVDASVINRIPSKDVSGVMVMNCPPEAMKAILQLAGFDGMANSFLGKYNTSLDEMMAATKGQMIFALSDFSMKKEEVKMEGIDYTYTTTKPDMNILFGVSVKDKASFDKLISIARANMGDAEQALSQVSYQTNNDWFAISNKKENVDKFLAGGNNQFEFTSKLTGNCFGLYVDIQKLMKASQSTVSEASAVSAFDASMKMWKDVVMTGGEWKDGHMSSEVVINMVDGKTNALKQLNQYAEQLVAAAKLRPSYKMDDMPMADSTTIMAPVIEAPQQQ